MARAVFDASAALALLRDEPGAELIAGYLGDALLSAVNLQEVIKKLLWRGFPIDTIKDMTASLRLEIRDHGEWDAYAAANLAEATAAIGAGLGDRACMALAISEGLPALTTDKAWAKLVIPGLKVILAR